MRTDDYYAILNVRRDASENEIRKAYRELARKHHPDKNPGDATAAAKFRQVTTAYEVLRDARERIPYDQRNPAQDGRDLEYTLDASLQNTTADEPVSIEQVTFQVEHRTIKLTLNKGDGIYRLRGAGKAGVYGGTSGDLFVSVNAKPQQLPDTIISNDGAEMVLIPAGEFLMGGADDEAHSNEQPVHPVYVDTFYMDRYLVTNAQYKVFVDANPQWRKDLIPRDYCDGDYLHSWNGGSYPDGKGNHPVTGVSWYAAMAYARRVGKRLPTEAEWEKAARGGLVGMKYPWGNTIDANMANYEENIGDTTPVDRYMPNRYGLYDMSGNVDEWCFDAYDETFYANSPHRNPVAGGQVGNNFTSVELNRVLRGGSWLLSARTLRVAARGINTPPYAGNLIGFRCARAVSP